MRELFTYSLIANFSVGVKKAIITSAFIIFFIRNLERSIELTRCIDHISLMMHT